LQGHDLLKKLKGDWFFWLPYILVVYLFLHRPMVIAWDGAEYLAQGKYIFSGLGYSSWHRPLVWPLILGFLWKLNIPMPFGMKAAAALLYILIPLITYLKFEDKRKYAGLIIASFPMFFQFSHLPLSHIIATAFILLSFSTDGAISGSFATLAGLSRFTYFVYLPFSLMNSQWKKRLKGAAIILVPYFIWALFFIGDPLFQFHAANDIINQPEFLWFWKQDIFYYLKLLTLSSPFLFLSIFNRKPTSLAFFASAIYFWLLPHKEMRFAIDFFIYGALSLSETKWGVRQIIYSLVICLFFPALYSSPNMFRNVKDGSTVFGMEPTVNAYKDVYFIQWFGPYENFSWDADYCIFSAGGMPCREGYCLQSIEKFNSTCRSWPMVAESESYYIGRNPNYTG